MGLKPYEAEVNGVQTTLLLTEEDAKARGLKEKSSGAKQAPRPANKARTAANKRQS